MQPIISYGGEFDLENRENFDGVAQVFRRLFQRIDAWAVISICSSTCDAKGAWIYDLVEHPNPLTICIDKYDSVPFYPMWSFS